MRLLFCKITRGYYEKRHNKKQHYDSEFRIKP